MYDVKQVCVEKASAENPDWGYARNCRALLRNPIAEFSQSTFSAQIGEFISPNRDYSYEGFSALTDGENWKFLDSLAFSLKDGKGVALRLIPKTVKIYPWKATYHYSFGDLGAELAVEYYLFRNSKAATLEVSFFLRGCKADDARLIVEPFADIRHMYSSSYPDAHAANTLPNGITIQREGRFLHIISKNVHAINLNQRKQEWCYKLGTGSREMREGAMRFSQDCRHLYSPGTLELSFYRNYASLQIFCSSQKKFKPSLELRYHDEKAFVSKLTRLQKPYSLHLKHAEHWGKEYRVALQGRLFKLMESFNFESPSLEGPDAGAFWFRNIWFRDAFQGVSDNFEIYFRNEKAYLKSLLLQALKLQEAGLIPNKLPELNDEKPDYSSADATLLCFICCLEYLRRTNDKTLIKAFRDAVKAFLQSLSSGSIRMENYLLKAPAHFSWIDSKYAARTFGKDASVPTRIPPAWLDRLILSCKDYDELSSKLGSPAYYFVELNALWIRFLRDFYAIFPSREFEALESNASINFKSFFFTEGVFELVDDTFQKSETLSSVSLYSASLLPELFSDEEIANLVNKFEPCLVYRNRKLFGVLTRNLQNHVYWNDADYHGAVVWPRESVPLFRLLHRLKDPRAQEILESNLDHQMEEGAIFFNQELFALPEGINPSPSPTSYSPVPVKNPAQFWSQWVQPYFDFLK